MTHSSSVQNDAGSLGPAQPIVIRGRLTDGDSWYWWLIFLVVFLPEDELLDAVAGVPGLLVSVVIVWLAGTGLRDCLWQWSRPLMTLDSSTLRWRMDFKRRYMEVDLEEVVDCGMGPGDDLHVSLASGAEHRFHVGQLSTAEEDRILTVLEDAAASNQVGE